MADILKIRVGKKRTIVIPKKVATELGIDEGTILAVSTEGGKLVLEPIPDAVTLSLKGKKIARITLKELEEESVAVQERYINER